MEPSLPDCSVNWSVDQKPISKPLNEVFRDQSILQTQIMSKAAFESMTFGFKSSLNPLTQEPIDLTFQAQDFVQITG